MTDTGTEMNDGTGTDELELTEEQRDALTLDRNVAITAGAGTGKTTTLTERYLRILEETDATPTEIATITFTNDAANEMRERIRAVVGDRLTDADADEYDRWRTIKDDLEDGYVHTIHGFCSRLLREHVVDAPVVPDFEVYDETDATTLAHDVVRDVLDERLDAGEADVERLARLWNRSTLEDVLVGLLGKRPTSETWVDRWQDADPDDYLDFLWDHVHPISPSLTETVFADPELCDAFETFRALETAGVVEDIDPADDRGSAKVRDVTRLLDEYRPLSASASVRDQQRFLDLVCDRLTTADGTRHGHDWWYWGSGSRWEKAGRDAEQEQLEDAVETFFDVVDPASLDFGVERDEVAAHYVLALVRTFDAVLDAYEAEKDRQNVLDYDDLVETTIGFLEDAPAVREQLQAQFDYVMVDEVQDTDPRQWTLVKLLTGGDPDDYDARNVFLVGDEKQSIYRFRGADVTTFADARAELDAANPDVSETNRELSGNFRTVEGTLAFVNDLFREVFAPLDGDSLRPYEADSQNLTAERRKGRDVTGECEYLLVPDDDYPELHGERYLEETPRFVESGEREAYAVAARLTRLLADPPTVYDEDAETYRDARPEDVSILLRSRTRLKAYERALDEFDVPYTVASGTGFYDSTEVVAVVNLLRVLENPSDERALYGILRSPLFGLEDDAIARLYLDDGGLWDALEEADSDLRDAYDCLQRWRRLAGTHPEVDAESATPWGTLLSRVIEETGYLASLAGDERPRQAAVNVNRLREQFRTWEEAGVKTAAGIVDRLETRRDVESHADEATIPEDAEAVEIRTIHSAKGLEFPIVVVPELGTEFNFQADVDDDGKVYLDEFTLDETGNQEPVLGIKSPSQDDAFVSDDTLVRRVTRDRMQRHERAELKRLLYVATTRARDHLLLSGVHDVEERDNGFTLAEPNDATDANCWRDWLHPVLLDDLSLSTLVNDGTSTSTLHESTYRVSRPAAPIDDWGRARSRSNPSLAIDVPGIEYRSPQVTVTASGYADLAADDGDDHASAAERDYDQDRGDDLHRGTLGTIVHRIAERRPDRDHWPEFARNVARRENETLANADLERILRDATRAIEFVDDHEAGLKDPTSYDELSVTARFDGVQVVGDIDHLVVTDEAYHVLDYKTNAVDTTGIDALADYYWPQLEAYATALNQSDPNREVHLVLYFTNCDEFRTRTLSLTDLDSLAVSVRDAITGDL